MAKVIFYNDSTCVLAVKNSKGGTTYTLFDNVSECVNYCKENGIEAKCELEG